MKSIRTRMTVIFVGLMMAMIAVIWGINKWYLEKYYITEKVESIEAAYDAFNWQLESNAERGISIQEAMKREQDTKALYELNARSCSGISATRPMFPC